MRIAHIVYSCVPERFRGGVAKVAFELACAQAAGGHEVEIFTTIYNSAERTEIAPGAVRETGGVIIRYFDVSSRRRFSSPALRKWIMSAPPFDVVHSHNTFLELNRVADRLGVGGPPVFFHPHGALDPIVVRKGAFRRLRKEVYLRLCERPLLNRAAGVFALTEEERRQLFEWGVKSPIEVVPNGVTPPARDESAAASLRVELGIPGSDRLIVFIGRIVPKKGLHLLLRAFAEVAPEQPDTRIVIAGDRSQDPTYVASLDSVSSDLGITDRVSWAGFVDERRKAALLTAASLFSHVTESEGMAMAPLEAMSAGVPTIVSDACYMGRAASERAVAETSFDARALSDVLRSYLGDELRRRELGRRGAQYAEQNHSWPAIAHAVVKTYAAALRPPRARYEVSARTEVVPQGH